jgi:hypothetical protein
LRLIQYKNKRIVENIFKELGQKNQKWHTHLQCNQKQCLVFSSTSYIVDKFIEKSKKSISPYLNYHLKIIENKNISAPIDDSQI